MGKSITSHRRRISVLLTFCLVLLLGTRGSTQASPQSRTKPEKKLIKMIAAGPDIILHNASVVSMDDQIPQAQAVAITGNLISAVGSDEEVLALQDVNTQVYDMEGRIIFPGLIEAHSHLLQNAFWDDGPEGLAQATKEMAADGYTTVHELYGDAGLIECARTLAQNKELSVRINCYIPYNSNSNAAVIPWQTYPYTQKIDTTLRVIGAKIFADGGSAGYPALSTLYQAGGAAGTHGDLFKTQDEMNAIVDTVLKAGYPIAMHAIGDSAVSVGLNAFENAFAGAGNVLRSRIEHLRVMREDLADKMASLGIAASIQYTWANAQSVAKYEVLYEPQVLQWIYPWRRLVDRGIPIIGGNDFPYCTRENSMQTISYLASRKTQSSDVLQDWLDGDQLTVEEGLRAMTVTNAWVAFEEDYKGTVTPGKLADLTILSNDPISTDPFDVRKITVEMTIMDGIIRYNKMGLIRTAVHDAGTFRMGIDDRGLWGPIRSGVGLEYGGVDYLYHGSLQISYDNNTVATANFQQQDYVTSTGGSIQMQEPGPKASEEALLVYEDGAAWHSEKLRIHQHTYAWDGEPFLLVEYTFENPSENDLSDIYIGQGMDFDIGPYYENMAAWDENNGLGFAYMYNAVSAGYPYIGMVTFDSTGSAINSQASFSSNSYFDRYGETQMSSIMRSGTIESGTAGTGDCSILLSCGPLSFEAQKSTTPFVMAIAVGDNLEELRTAVNMAYDRFANLSSVDGQNKSNPGGFILNQNFPNPFNGSTKISYALPRSEMVTVSIFTTAGRLVETLVSEFQEAGMHTILWNAGEIGAGVYLYRISAGAYTEMRKCLLLK